jgi:hypothetical protein
MSCDMDDSDSIERLLAEASFGCSLPHEKNAARTGDSCNAGNLLGSTRQRRQLFSLHIVQTACRTIRSRLCGNQIRTILVGHIANCEERNLR